MAVPKGPWETLKPTEGLTCRLVRLLKHDKVVPNSIFLEELIRAYGVLVVRVAGSCVPGGQAQFLDRHVQVGSATMNQKCE